MLYIDFIIRFLYGFYYKIILYVPFILQYIQYNGININYILRQAFSRQDIAEASFALLFWLVENIPVHELLSYFLIKFMS